MHAADMTCLECMSTETRCTWTVRTWEMNSLQRWSDTSGQMEYLLGRMWTRMTLNSTSSAAGSRMTIKMFLSSARMYHSILTISTEVQISAR